MFVDLVGSTALSTRLDPEDMREVLRVYQNTVTGEIARVDGHVAKLMGDGVLSYFGWPRAHEDDAERAVRAGLAIGTAVGRALDPGRRAACDTGWHCDRPGGRGRPRRRGCGARRGRGGRDAELGREAAGDGLARRRGDRGWHAPTLGRVV